MLRTALYPQWRSLHRYGPGAVAILCIASGSLSAQNPSTPGTKATITASPAAIRGSGQNPEAVTRGGKLFAEKCGGCHGATAKGTTRGPDLVRSVLVLDDEKGILISPVIRNGRPEHGMPKIDVTEPQIADLVSWIHAQTYAADHRTTYVYLDVVTGDAKKGEAYFNGAGGCKACHSVTGDLAGIAGRFDPHDLQSRWLQPRAQIRAGGRGGAVAAPPSRSASTVTVTLPSGKSFTGVLDRVDDFSVSLRDAAGDYRSFDRDGDSPKVEIQNPLKAHTDLLRKYTDADIHNMTAYLVTLK